jgi:NAD(P)-dependent dehydrogenase (short-subunit alcohol dehydrogenase family)
VTKRFEGRVVLITGAASGIGAAVRRFTSEGASSWAIS